MNDQSSFWVRSWNPEGRLAGMMRYSEDFSPSPGYRAIIAPRKDLETLKGTWEHVMGLDQPVPEPPEPEFDEQVDCTANLTSSLIHLTLSVAVADEVWRAINHRVESGRVSRPMLGSLSQLRDDLEQEMLRVGTDQFRPVEEKVGPSPELAVTGDALERVLGPMAYKRLMHLESWRKDVNRELERLGEDVARLKDQSDRSGENHRNAVDRLTNRIADLEDWREHMDADTLERVRATIVELHEWVTAQDPMGRMNTLAERLEGLEKLELENRLGRLEIVAVRMGWYGFQSETVPDDPPETA